MSSEASQPDDPRQARALRIQGRFEWPVVIAALLTVPLVVIQESSLRAPWPEVARVLNWVTWSIFALGTVVMLAIVPNRWRWLKSHIVHVLVVVTPPFAPAGWQSGRLFRLVRLLRLVRILALRRLLSLEGMRYAAMVAAGTVIVGGVVFASVEEKAGDHDLGRRLVGGDHGDHGRLWRNPGEEHRRPNHRDHDHVRRHRLRRPADPDPRPDLPD